MDRRKFVRAVTGSGVVAWTVRAQVTVYALGEGGEARAEKVYDLNMVGYSIYDGQMLGPTGVLTATQIVAGKALNLPYTQDDHGHKFDLTEQHLKDLIVGKSVEVETTVAQDHKHKVKIDPSNHANENGIEASQTTTSATGTETSGGTGSQTTPPSDLRKMLDEHCTECHHAGSAAPIDLTAKVPDGAIEKIMERVKSTDPKKIMPPGFRRTLESAEIEQLQKLLKSGG